MFLNISLKAILKNKWVLIVLASILIISSALMFAISERIILGKKMNKNTANLFEINSYYSEYELTVLSNKNVNTYIIKEWYKEGRQKTQCVISTNNIMEIINNGNSVYISNSNEMSKLILNNLNLGNNITSFSTLIEMYNCILNIDNKCNCEMSQYEKEDIIQAHISICNGKVCECNICKYFTKAGIIEIIIDINKDEKTRIAFNVYDKNKNVIYSIVYTKFESDIEFEDDMFQIK